MPPWCKANCSLEVAHLCATCNILRQLLIDRGMNPSLAMTIGSELGERIETTAIETVGKVKRKASGYNRAYSKHYKSIKAKHTLKNGKMAKGWGGKKGHMRILEAAHKATRKEMKK